MTTSSAAVHSDAASGTRFPGLDGLRALAVLMVVSHNFGPAPGFSRLGRLGWFRSGYVGVTLFFVLSGFLITQRLIAGFERDAHVDFRRFWSRRARRLLPALAIALTLLVIDNARNHVSFAETYRALFAAVFYVFNLVGVHRPPSNPLGGPGWGPLWSLSVEEQFYLVWPMPLIWGWRRFGARRTLVVVGALGCLSAAWTVALWWGGSSFNRLYLATDTRSQSLLIGAALGIAWHGVPGLRRLGRRHAGVLGALCLALVGLGMFGSGADPSASPGWLLGPGLLLTTLLGAFVVLTAIESAPGGVASRVLNSRPMVAIGRRSYGIYLFHPACEALVGKAKGAWFLAFAATLTLAFASFRFVEQPLLG